MSLAYISAVSTRPHDAEWTAAYRRMTPYRNIGGLGNAADDVASAAAGLSRTLNSGAIGAATEILRDPALPLIIGDIAKLHDLEQPTSGAEVPGIGLRRIVKPLHWYVYSVEHPWVLPVAVVAVLAIPFLIGRATR